MLCKIRTLLNSIDGRVVMRDGKLTTLDEREVIERARDEAEKIASVL